MPSREEAASWFLEIAREAVRSGDRLDADAVRLLMALAPGDPIVAIAINQLADEAEPPSTLAEAAHAAVASLRQAVLARDGALARQTVTALETEVLRAYRPSLGLGRCADDVAVSLALLAAFDVGGDEAHLMMAEELMLGVLRREWPHRAEHGLAVNCDAAVALAALHARTGKAEYRARALEILDGYAVEYRALGVRAAPYVSALQMIS